MEEIWYLYRLLIYLAHHLQQIFDGGRLTRFRNAGFQELLDLLDVVVDVLLSVDQPGLAPLPRISADDA